MEEQSAVILKRVLNDDEINQIPSGILTKVESFIQENFEEFLTSKAVFQSERDISENKLATLKNELDEITGKYETDTARLKLTLETSEELQNEVTNLRSQLSKLEDKVISHEKEVVSLRQQRDNAVDERNELLTTLERRNTELGILRTDLSTMTRQMQEAVNSKCEALLKADEVSSRELAVKFKEQELSSIRPMLEEQIKSLTEDLNRSWTEVANVKREQSSSIVVLESKLASKIEEVRIHQSQVAKLTETNTALETRVDELVQKVKELGEESHKMRDSYREEIASKTRLAELYKEASDDQERKNNQFVERLECTHKELEEMSDKCAELESKISELTTDFESKLTKKNECIESLKQELESANELLVAKKQELLEKAVESLAPSAAITSRVLKSGMTLTQIYSEYCKVAHELVCKQNQVDQLNDSLQVVLKEIEEKAPIIEQQRMDHRAALQNIDSLKEQLDNLIGECNSYREECAESKRLSNYHMRENAKLRNQLSDLGRQVCFLTKTIHELRGDTVSMNDSCSLMETPKNAADLISKKLVTFKDIQELQANNEQLLVIVREMTSRLEEAEKNVGSTDAVGLQVRIDQQEKKILGLQESQEQQMKMVNSVIRQRDTYRKLYQELLDNSPGAKAKLDKSIDIVEEDANQSKRKVPPISPELFKYKAMEKKLLQSEDKLKKLEEEYETYRKEKQTNESMLNEQLEQIRTELFDVKSKLSARVASGEYNEERVKNLKQNVDTLRKQISTLEDQNKNYNNTIVKHEQTIMRFKDETLDAVSKCSKAEVMLEQLRRENKMLQESEMRLQKQQEVINREKQGQALLLNNLELIKASFERSETEGRIRLENRLDEATRESSALRRRLQEEQDRFRELSSHLERQTDAAKQRAEEAQSQAEKLREELTLVRSELVSKTNQISELSSKIQKSLMTKEDESVDVKRARELENEINQSRNEILSLQTQLESAREQIKQYTDISESAEKELKDLYNKHAQYTTTTESALSQAAVLESELRKKIQDLEAEIAKPSNQSTTDIVQNTNQEDLEKLQKELEVYKKELTDSQEQIEKLSKSLQTAEEKYGNELVLHSSDIQTLATLKEELHAVKERINDLQAEKDRAEQTLLVSKTNWIEQERKLEEAKLELADKMKDLNSQNEVLHEQIQTLSTQLAVAHASGHSDNMNTSSAGDTSLLNRSVTDEDLAKSSDQLLQVIKFLRKEKTIADAKVNIMQDENNRLKSEYEIALKQFEESKKALEAERSKSDISQATTAKHTEVLRSVETLNAITDSNRVLREERDSLKKSIKEYMDRITELEEQLAPLQETNKSLQAKADNIIGENVTLKAETMRWKHRVNQLIEKANKTSPEDWKRLQNEREGLVKMLTTEKENVRKTTEELNTLKTEKSKLEDYVSNLTKQQQIQAAEMKKHNEEVASLKQQIAKLTQEVTEAKEASAKSSEEQTKLSDDLAAKDLALTEVRNKEIQIRKIAKRYKDQFLELSKTHEEDKKKSAEAAASAANQSITPQQLETAREETRKPLMDRITEIETENNRKLAEATTEMNNLQAIVENLRKENEELKTICADKEEKHKNLIKNARSKILSLSESRNALDRDLTDTRNRLESAEQSKGESEVRLTQYEQRIARLEKERNDLANDKQEAMRLTQQIENLTQRNHQLQRQLGLQQGSKPTTSAGSLADKPGNETSTPPTANIKPMAGHSSGQSSATVQPWRNNDTPFASIRPMSVPRTVAVLPTSQSVSGSGGSCASQSALVPPQQQVHTTGNSTSGEAMSTSPTSSHMDYMPATSSAALASSGTSTSGGPVRQVAVPPMSSTTTSSSSGAGSGSVLQQQQQPIQLQQQPMQQQEMAGTSAESTQVRPVLLNGPLISSDMETSQQSTQGLSQSVALVQPRIEIVSNPQIVHGTPHVSVAPSHSSEVVSHVSNVMVSQQQASSSSNVTTTVAAAVGAAGSSTGGHKRPRESSEGTTDTDNLQEQQRKRTRQQHVVQGSTVEGSVSKSGLDSEIEYQVPTSSQRDQEDDNLIVDSEASEDGLQEPDDGPYENNGEEYENEIYEQEQDLAYDEGDEDNGNDTDNMADNNEVEIIDDSNEGPNQSEGSNSASGITESNNAPPNTSQQIQTISSGSEGMSGSQSMPSTPRSRCVAPLARQSQAQALVLPHHSHHLTPGYEEAGDDGIVPSTPTLYVPRRNDGFGEAVSSPHPHVPSARFTFSDTTAVRQVPGAPLSQSGLEAVDDTRCDLSQFHEAGPSGAGAPLQVCPQAQNTDDSLDAPEVAPGPSEPRIESIPPEIKINAAAEDCIAIDDDDDDVLDAAMKEADGDPVSSEGEQQASIADAIEIEEEGREAEASQSPSSNTRFRGRGGTARRSTRGGAMRGPSGRIQRPTPIVWNEAQGQRQQQMQHQHHQQQQQQAQPQPLQQRQQMGMPISVRGMPQDAPRGIFVRGTTRGRRMRRPGGPNFPGMRYQ